MKPALTLAAAAALALAACQYDPGGRLDTYAARIDLADAARGATIPIPRRCESACVMRLSSPATCVPRDSSIGLHGITILSGGPRAQLPQELAYYNRLPEYLREVWWTQARHLPRHRFLNISGEQLIAMGAEECR